MAFKSDIQATRFTAAGATAVIAQPVRLRGIVVASDGGGAGTVKQTEHNQNQYKEETIKNSEENQDKRFCEPIWIFEK